MAKTYMHPEFRALQNARIAGEPMQGPWEAFRTKALARSDHPPSVAADVVAQLKRHQGDRAPHEIAILDQGCGSGFILLYLLALGYTGIHGVDVEVNEANPVWNGFCRDIAGLEGRRFYAYDGLTMPFEDDQLSLIHI